MEINAERLAYWYLRLNGFLTITNFIVHPDKGNEQGTDVDLLAVRLPHRAENLVLPMEDDENLYLSAPDVAGKILVVLVEVKASECRLNGSWTNTERRNMLRVLRAFGPLPEAEAEIAAQSLYQVGCYSASPQYHIAILLLGERKNPIIANQFPLIKQLTWNDALTFIFQRFKAYRRQKVSHGQWDEDGKNCGTSVSNLEI